MKREPYNPMLRHAIMEVVENQLRDGTPPEARLTLERLQKEGLSHKQATELIACAVSAEIFDVLKIGKPYDNARYVTALNALPRLPWEKEA
jgi:hypothetical protein